MLCLRTRLRVVLTRKKSRFHKPPSKPGWGWWLNGFGVHLNRRSPGVLLPTPKNSAVFQVLPWRWGFPIWCPSSAVDPQPKLVSLARLWIKSSFEIFYNLAVHTTEQIKLVLTFLAQYCQVQYSWPLRDTVLSVSLTSNNIIHSLKYLCSNKSLELSSKDKQKEHTPWYHWAAKMFSEVYFHIEQTTQTLTLLLQVTSRITWISLLVFMNSHSLVFKDIY